MQAAARPQGRVRRISLSEASRSCSGADTAVCGLAMCIKASHGPGRQDMCEKEMRSTRPGRPCAASLPLGLGVRDGRIAHVPLSRALEDHSGAAQASLVCRFGAALARPEHRPGAARCGHLAESIGSEPRPTQNTGGTSRLLCVSLRSRLACIVVPVWRRSRAALVPLPSRPHYDRNQPESGHIWPNFVTKFTPF